MANIFDGLRKMDDAILKIQIAMLEEVTISNIKQEIKQKAKRKTVKAANHVTNLIIKKQFDEPEVLNLENRIEKYIEKIDNLSKQELILKIKHILAKRMNEAGEVLYKNSSEEALSAAVINCAAKHYKKTLTPELTPAQRADVVRHKFNDELVKKSQKVLCKQEYAQAREFEQLLQSYIKSLEEEQIKDYKNTVNQNNISGNAIRNLFMTDDGACLILKVLDNVEPNKHNAFKSVISGVFLNTLGINIPFDVKNMKNYGKMFIEDYSGWISYIGIENLMSKNGKSRLLQELMMIILWSSQEMYGRCFTPYLEELSCWLEGDEREETINEIKEIDNLMNTVSEYEKKYIELKADYVQDVETLDKHNTMIEELRKTRHEANAGIIQEHEELNELEKKVVEAQENYIQETNNIDKLARANKLTDDDRTHLDNIKIEYEQARKNVADKRVELEKRNKASEEALNAINKKLIDTKDLKESVAKQKEYLEQFVKQTSKIKDELEEKTEKMAEFFRKKWVDTYTRFEFGKDVLKNIVTTFEYDEICDIEAVIKELSDSKDPYALRDSRRGALQKGEFLSFLTIYDKNVRLYYKAVERDEDSEKQVYITDVVHGV